GSDPVKVTLSNPQGPDRDRFSLSLNLPTDHGSFMIEAGGVVTLSVSVAPVKIGPLLAVVALDSCGGACPQAIVLEAIGDESGVVCPSSLDLGVVNPGKCATQSITCMNAGNATERITVAELEPSSAHSFSVVPPALPIDLAPGATFQV